MMLKAIAMLSTAVALSVIASVADAGCYIDIAICGFRSLGSTSETVDAMSNWTILHPHTIGSSGDGTFFAEVVLLGKSREHDSMCYAEWQSPAGTYCCPNIENPDPSYSVVSETGPNGSNIFKISKTVKSE